MGRRIDSIMQTKYFPAEMLAKKLENNYNYTIMSIKITR